MHSQRQQRLARKHEFLIRFRARLVVRSASVLCRLTSALRHCCHFISIARTTISKALDWCVGAEARDTARECGARASHGDAQINSRVTSHIHACKVAAQRVERRIVSRVCRTVAQLKVNMNRATIRLVYHADVHVSDRRCSPEVGTHAAEVAVLQVCVFKREADALTDTRCERGRRQGRRPGWGRNRRWWRQWWKRRWRRL